MDTELSRFRPASWASDGVVTQRTSTAPRPVEKRASVVPTVVAVALAISAASIGYAESRTNVKPNAAVVAGATTGKNHIDKDAVDPAIWPAAMKLLRSLPAFDDDDDVEIEPLV